MDVSFNIVGHNSKPFYNVLIMKIMILIKLKILLIGYLCVIKLVMYLD